MDLHAYDHGISRRQLLGLSVSGALGLAFGRVSPLFAGEGKLPGFGAAEHVVLLYMAGGASQLETWDPKPGTKQGGPTGAIATRAKGVKIAATLPRLADQMHRVALVRSMATGEGNHQRGRYLLHTGYVPSGTVRHPDVGALVSQQKADLDSDLPPYVAVSATPPGSGILGPSCAPFTVVNPLQPIANMSYPTGVDAERFRRRRKLLDSLEAGFERRRGASREADGHRAITDKADRLMHSPRLGAFTLDDEPAELRAAYGEGKFGQGCLMARRLIEQGARVVEVQLGNWDTHQDNFNRTADLCAQLDAGFATLLSDLDQRDLLRKTLIVCMSEFGRTPRINPNEGRDHFARAWSLALAGGPIRGGAVVGATTADGMQVAERPTQAQDVVATIAHAVGLDAARINYTPNGRPIRVVDAKGKVIPELLAG